jgi:AraC-like DNA-binding protein
MDSLYNILTIGLAFITTGFAVLFRNLYSCNKAEMNGYRKASRLMIAAYLFFGIVNVADYLGRTSDATFEDNIVLFQMLTLIVAISQAFLFTYAMILLINRKYVTKRRFLRELIIILAVSTVGIIGGFLFSAETMKVFIGLFILFYISLLIRYTRTFINIYRQCLTEMDNFFSGREKENLQWVIVSFFLALGIGIIALTASLLPTVHIGNICSLIYLLFYVWFAVRFINYSFVFKMMEEAMSDTLSTEATAKTAFANERKYEIDFFFFLYKINLWIKQKGFTQANISIADLSCKFAVNRYYLSKYINENKCCNFNVWVNGLRIEEAKNILQNNPDISVTEVATDTGFLSNAYFGALFLKNTGQTPQQWRKNQSAT